MFRETETHILENRKKIVSNSKYWATAKLFDEKKKQRKMASGKYFGDH